MEISGPINARNKRRLYPTVFCYHGCVAHRSKALTFRSHTDDIKAHIAHLRRAGYRYVRPSEYKRWFLGELDFEGPIACMHFDDCLDTIGLIIPWLIEQGLPCGIAVPSRRLSRYDPEDGFARWSWLREWTRTGLVEIMSHTHNLHHLTLIKEEDEDEGTSEIVNGPILEGPCWIDDGDVVYLLQGDSRWYWDYSHVDTITLGLPMWGTDPYDGRTPITTKLFITPKVSGSVAVLRLWMGLSAPSGSGYDVRVQIRADGRLVWNGIIKPKVYDVRTQWVEREFYSITLDAPFNITAGQALELEFKTLNIGAGAALLLALCTNQEAAFGAITNCQGLYPEGSQGEPERFWQYIDYPADTRWPIIPCLILGFDSGREATVDEYKTYIAQDCADFSASLTNYQNAEWDLVTLWEAPRITYRIKVRVAKQPHRPTLEWREVTEHDYAIVGWWNPDRWSATINLKSDRDVLVEWLRFEMGTAEFFPWGAGDPWHADKSNAVETSLPDHPPLPPSDTWYWARSYPATFRLYVRQAGASAWNYIGDSPIWQMSRNRSVDVEPFNMTAGQSYQLLIEPINRGPTVNEEQITRWPIKNVVGGVKKANAPVTLPDCMVYPFGAYYSEGVGLVEGGYFTDISPDLKEVLTAAGFDHGYTIQPYRAVKEGEKREPDLRHTNWGLPRWLVYGDQALAVSRNNLAAYSGFLFHDVRHRGVEWQVSLEADEGGNASIHHKADVLDYVAFDAYYFDGEGNIQPHSTNDGGTYYGEPHPDDKGFLQERGVKCLLIINNNAGTGEPDEVIGAHVVNNPDLYIPQMLELCRAKGWDGLTINIEQMGPEHKTAATAFYQQAARAMHQAGLIMHATVPAITGTDYDAPWWMGWCDLGELAKVCDAIKIMSYTETGPGTEPGPAAPDWFWAATYDYTRRVIHPRFWPRVFCGCRSFGHLWEWNNLDEAEFMTYHNAIADGLTAGRRFDIESTEMGWSNNRLACWCGTPLTVDRSQIEAVKSGFGGLGLWKLDDGDVQEFLPDCKQIGREEDMSFLNVRFPEDISFGSSGGPNYQTNVSTTTSGDEFRTSVRTRPWMTYEVNMTARTKDQAEAVKAFFLVARGKARSFRFKDWSDYRLDNVLIGRGDGATRNFQCVKAYAVGSETLIRTITKLRLTGGGFDDFEPFVVRVNEVEQTGGLTINDQTGLISFTAPPAAGAAISVSGEFDVQARFDTDSLSLEIISKSGDFLFKPGVISLVEVSR